MNISYLIGCIAIIIVNVFGILSARGNLFVFIDIASIIITGGGGLMSLLIAYGIGPFLRIPKILRKVLFPTTFAPDDTIIMLISFSEKARREGLLVLEDDLTDINDEFLRKGLQLVVDGTDPELVKHILNTEIEEMESRHDSVRDFFVDASALFPSWGMIGTLIGLVIMLGNIGSGSAEAIGSAMATALITTFYGAVLAYGFMAPTATVLKQQHDEEDRIRKIMLEGILSIQSGDNPRIVKDKLVSFLAPNKRKAVNEKVGDR